MRTLRSFVSRISGGTHPRAVGLAVFFGLLAGFVQGWNLSLVALFVLIVLFDVRSRVALVCWGVGVGLSWLLAPVTFLLGRVVLDLTPLGNWLGQLGDGRWATLFGFDQYTVVGGLLIGLALAWPASSLLTRSVRRTRSLLRQARELRGHFTHHNEPDVIAFPRSRISRRARFVDWMRGVTPASETASGDRLFRRGGLTAAAALIAVTSGVLFWHLPQMASGRLYLSMQAANQARLEASAFKLALWDGSLEIRDLRLADPNCLTHDRLRVAELRADFDTAALLAGRLAIRRLDVSGVRTHVERPQAAPALVGPLAQATAETSTTVMSTSEGASLPAGGVQIEQSVGRWPELQQAIGRFGELIAQLQNLPACEDQRAPSLSLSAIAQTDVTVLRHARSSLGKVRPKISVASLRVAGLDPAWHLGEQAVLRAEQLSSIPATGAGAARVEIDAPDCGTRLWAEYAPHQGTPRWTAHVDIKQVSLARQSNIAAPQPLAIDAGHLAVVGSGWANAQGFAMPLRFEAHDLACHANERKQLAGINAEVWAAGLGRMGTFVGEAVCYGAWEEPRLEIDPQLFAEKFRHQLRSSGQHELLAQLDAQQAPGQPQDSDDLAQTDKPASGANRVATSAVTQLPTQLPEPMPLQPAAVAQNTAPVTPNSPVAAETGPPTPTNNLAATSPVTADASTTALPTSTTSQPPQVVQQSPATTSGPSGALPVIEVGRPNSNSLPAPAPTDGTTPVVAAIPTPLQGPGPVDLALGHDMATDTWSARSAAYAENVAQTNQVPRATQWQQAPEREHPTDAELDKWVKQQERAEAKRERELARKAESRENFEDDWDLESESLEPAETAPKTSWFAKVRNIWPFGKTTREPVAPDLAPDARADEPARTARGPVTAPDGEAIKLR